MRNKNFLAIFLFLISSNFLTESSGLPADICDGTETVQFLPHPENCAKYVLCLMGVGTEVDCPTNQIFDEVNGRCEPGDPITCELFTTTPPTTTTTTTFTDEPTTTTTTEEITTTTTTTEDITTTTTTEPTTTTTVTDEPTTTTTTEEITTTTTTFTEEPTTTTTTTESTTTTTTTIPDIPTTTTTTQSTTTTSTEPGPEITTPSTTTTQRPIGPPELCTGNNFRFIPDPDYCYRFYYCMFGIALPGTCDPDRIFSERWRGCVFGNWETCEADNPITIVTSISPWN